MERTDVIANALVPEETEFAKSVPVRIPEEVHAETLRVIDMPTAEVAADRLDEAPQWDRKSSRLYLYLLLMMIGMNLLLVSKLYEKGTMVASQREDLFISTGSGRTGLVHRDGLYRWFVVADPTKCLKEKAIQPRTVEYGPGEGPEPVVEPVILVGVIEPTEVVAEPVGVVRPNAYPKDRGAWSGITCRGY